MTLGELLCIELNSDEWFLFIVNCELFNGELPLEVFYLVLILGGEK